MFDQILEQRIRKAVFVGPLGITEDTVKGIWVGLLDAAHGRLERVTDVGALRTDLLPMATFGNLKTMVFWELRERYVSTGFFESDSKFFIIDIGDSLKKEQREDVGLKVGSINGTTQDIGGFPEVVA